MIDHIVRVIGLTCIFFSGGILIFLTIFACIQPQYDITDDKAIRAIVGEASNQSFYTKQCVAHALRNRGTLKGVYGVQAKHSTKEAYTIWLDSAQAWQDSEHSIDPTDGATEFRSINDPQPTDMRETASCGEFLFYKQTK